MNQSILLIGESGSGKSTSLFPNEALEIKGLDPKETFIINISKKSLPFAGWKSKYKEVTRETMDTGNILHSDNSKDVLGMMDYVSQNRPEIKNLVIEDTNLSSSKTFFDGYGQGNGYDLWNTIGQDLGNIVMAKDKLRDDLTVIFVFHIKTEEGTNGQLMTKVKTIGKLVDNYIEIPSKFTYVIHAVKTFNPIDDKAERWFWVNDLQGSPCKAPYGCFETPKIKNDMGYVLAKIEEHENCENC